MLEKSQLLLYKHLLGLLYKIEAKLLLQTGLRGRQERLETRNYQHCKQKGLELHRGVIELGQNPQLKADEKRV